MIVWLMTWETHVQEIFHPADIAVCNPVQAEQQGLGRGRSGEAGDGPSYHCLDVVEHVGMVLCSKTLWWRRGKVPKACMRCKRLSCSACSSKIAEFALIFLRLVFFPTLCEALAPFLVIHRCQEERYHPNSLPPVSSSETRSSQVAHQQAASLSIPLRFQECSREQEDEWTWMWWKYWVNFSQAFH